MRQPESGDRVSSKVDFNWPQATKKGDIGRVLLYAGENTYLVQFNNNHQARMHKEDIDLIEETDGSSHQI